MALAIYVTGISTPEVHLESPPLPGTLTLRQLKDASGRTLGHRISRMQSVLVAENSGPEDLLLFFPILIFFAIPLAIVVVVMRKAKRQRPEEGVPDKGGVGLAVGGGCLFVAIGGFGMMALCAGAPEMQGEAGLGCLAALPVGGAIGGVVGTIAGRAIQRKRTKPPPRPDI